LGRQSAEEEDDDQVMEGPQIKQQMMLNINQQIWKDIVEVGAMLCLY
jgi:hypothetical protein